MKQLLTAAVLIAGSASNVASGERNLTEAFKVCMAKSEGITSKMNDCISFEHQRQDARLNIAFQQVLRQSGSQRQARVRDVQHKWMGDPQRRWWHVYELLAFSPDRKLVRQKEFDGWVFGRYLTPMDCG